MVKSSLQADADFSKTGLISPRHRANKANKIAESHRFDGVILDFSISNSAEKPMEKRARCAPARKRIVNHPREKAPVLDLV
jgi:hypothetical protein